MESGRIRPKYIPTSEITADVLTKGLPRDKIEYCRPQMGLVRDWRDVESRVSVKGSD